MFLSSCNTQRSVRTLKGAASLQGTGLHLGQPVTVTVEPHSQDGVWFQRTDLPGTPRIRAIVGSVVDTRRCTAIGEGQATVHTIEHLMAALHAASIDRCLISVNGPELPAACGCSSPYVEMLEEAGFLELDESLTVATLDRPIYWSEGETHLVALPADELRLSYVLNYPDCSAIGSQYYSVSLDWTTFVDEVAPCRTYGHYHEIEALRKAGLIQGGSLDCAVVIRDGVVVNEEGLRFPNEMVRHKLLDLAGDLALVGRPFTAHVMAVCAGHRSHVELAKGLYQHFTME